MDLSGSFSYKISPDKKSWSIAVLALISIFAKENYDWAYNEIGGKHFISSEKACINLGLNYRDQFKKYIGNFIWKK